MGTSAVYRCVNKRLHTDPKQRVRHFEFGTHFHLTLFEIVIRESLIKSRHNHFHCVQLKRLLFSRGGGNLGVILVRVCVPVFFKPTPIIYLVFEKK